MSTPKIEPWMLEAAKAMSNMDLLALVSPSIADRNNGARYLAEVIARHVPASLERELVEALRDAMKFIAIEDVPTMHAHACAVLRKYEATHPPTPAHD